MKIDTFTKEEIRLAEGIYLILMKKHEMIWEDLPLTIKNKYCDIARQAINKIREDEEGK